MEEARNPRIPRRSQSSTSTVPVPTRSVVKGGAEMMATPANRRAGRRDRELLLPTATRAIQEQ